MKTVFCLNFSVRNKKNFFFFLGKKEVKTEILQPQPNIPWTGTTARGPTEKRKQGKTCKGKSWRRESRCFMDWVTTKSDAKFLLEIQFLWLSARTRIPKAVCAFGCTSPSNSETGSSASFTKLTWSQVNAWAKQQKRTFLSPFSCQGWNPWKLVGFLFRSSAESWLPPCGFSPQPVDVSARPWWTASPAAAGSHPDSHEEEIPPGPLASLSGCRSWQSIVSLQRCCRERRVWFWQIYI